MKRLFKENLFYNVFFSNYIISLKKKREKIKIG